jgi:hypothetical protein
VNARRKFLKITLKIHGFVLKVISARSLGLSKWEEIVILVVKIRNSNMYQLETELL